MVSAADKLYTCVQSAQFLGLLAADSEPEGGTGCPEEGFLAVLQVVAVQQAVTMGARAPVLGLVVDVNS